MVREVPYPQSGFNNVTCACGNKLSLHWNGGELDGDTCKCGRKYWGEHRATVLMIQEPGEDS